MRVTKWGECGILCSLYLAKKFGGPATGATEIAESQGLDTQYTQQILHRLRKGGVIESERGPRGGYRLSRAPELISLKEILYAAEGDTFQIICEYAPIHPDSTDNSHCVTKESCGLHGVWQELRAAIDNLLEQRTLKDLLERNIESSEPLVQLTNRSRSERQTS
jgi:Rrf2 family iron-sulfur cluster assembly transcriptional regulator